MSLTRAERTRLDRVSAVESGLGSERPDSVRLEEMDAALKLQTIRELGKFDRGQFEAVNRSPLPGILK